MRHAGEALLTVLTAAGMGAPWLAGIGDLFVGSENGMNSGEIPLNLALAGIPSAAAMAVIAKTKDDLAKAEDAWETARELSAREFERDLRSRVNWEAEQKKMDALADQGLEGSAKRLDEELTKKMYEARDEMLREEKYKKVLEGLNKDDIRLDKMSARRPGMVAAVTGGLGIPIAGWMGMDWMPSAERASASE